MTHGTLTPCPIVWIPLLLVALLTQPKRAPAGDEPLTRLGLRPAEQATAATLEAGREFWDPAAWKTVFQDDFSAGLTDNWKPYDGAWGNLSVEDGVLQLRDGAYLMAVLQKDFPGNVAVRYRARDVGGSRSLWTMLHGIAGGEKWPWNGAVLVQFGTDGGAGTNVRILGREGEKVPVGVQTGTWHEILVIRLGNQLTLAVDRKLVLRERLSPEQTASFKGSIGLMSFKDIDIDDVRVMQPADAALQPVWVPRPSAGQQRDLALALARKLGADDAQARAAAAAFILRHSEALRRPLRDLLREGAVQGAAQRRALLAVLRRQRTEAVMAACMPQASAIRDMPPPAPAPGRPGPLAPFADDETITHWVYTLPVKLDWGTTFLRQTASKGFDEVVAAMGPVPADSLMPSCSPDFKAGYNLHAASGKRDDTWMGFYCRVEVKTTRLVRLCCEPYILDPGVRFWINGRTANHGDFLRLQPGVHILVALVNSCRAPAAGWQWRGRHWSPRFSVITEADIAELDAWRRQVWEETREWGLADPRDLTAHIRFKPGTGRGKEGFFRLQQSVNGMWWFLSPEGQPFYHSGICGMNRGHMGGRRSPLNTPLAPDEVKARLSVIEDRWGFNGLGAWTTAEFFDQGVAFTEILEGFYCGPYLTNQGKYVGGGGAVNQPDVFSEAWIRAVEKKCEQYCAPLKDSRDLLGYFLDNERGFLMGRRGKTPVYTIGKRRGERKIVVAAEIIDNPRELGMLQFLLSLENKHAATRKAWEFVTGKYGDDLAALGKAWGVKLKSRLSFNEMTINNERLGSEAYMKDEMAFRGLFIDQYFRVMCDAIRRHDPNHLILGCRWGNPPDRQILEIEGRHVDVVSGNSYRSAMAEILERNLAGGRPLLNGESDVAQDAFRLVRDAIEPPGGYRYPQQRQFVRWHDTLERFFTHPGYVGYTCYKWKKSVPNTERRIWPCNPYVNLRALAVRAQADRPWDASGSEPVHGQVYFYLGSDPVLGLICRRGTWDPTVYGATLRGKVETLKGDGNAANMVLNFEQKRGLFVLQAHRRRCELTFTRTGPRRFEGTYRYLPNGSEERLTGFLHRPVASPRL